MITSANIKGKTFGTARNGYDPDEVRAFLDDVAKAVEELMKKAKKRSSSWSRK